MGVYLCYDLRGIQSFIFRIPKLKYIIGGSALIDRFDRDTAPKLADGLGDGVEHLYSGGGKGAFYCHDKSKVEDFQKKLVYEAHDKGIDIRIGRGSDFEQASQNAQELYPFIAQPLTGSPCPKTGLYPTEDREFEHPIVHKRIFDKDKDEKMYRYFENYFNIKEIKLPAADNKPLSFFRDINKETNPRGAKALGGRNRWAVICMDGNDLGMQYRKMTQLVKVSNLDLTRWIKAMSKALDECTKEATRKGIQQVVSEWAKTKDFDPKPEYNEIILPIRPLVVGGDDIIVLCHVSYAMTFVREVKNVFRTESAEWNKKTDVELWPATGGEISISAGVLFCPVNLPLHTAISYTEALLASAKTKGRQDEEAITEPSQECIDWDQITDSIVDTPQARRERELVFTDGDTDNQIVKLTKRPCAWEEFEAIEKLSQQYKYIPTSLHHRILPGLRQGFSDRLAFVAEIAKHQVDLAVDIAEDGYLIHDKPSRWKQLKDKDRLIQETDVIDALLLLEEQRRMQEGTAHV